MNPLKNLLILTILLTSCVELNETLESDWSNSMQGLAGSYNKALPYIYDSKSFKNPSNKNKISVLIQQIVEDSENIEPRHQRQMLGSDPLFSLTLQELKSTSVEAEKAYSNKQYETSRYLLKNSVLFCAQCHVQSKRGPEVLEWDNFANISNASPIDQAKVYLATRQFTKAQRTVGDYINSSPLPSDLELLKGLKSYINITMHRDRNPKSLIQKIDRIKKNRHFTQLSSQTQRTISTWKSYLRDWSKEIDQQKLPSVGTLIKSSDSGRFITENGYITALRNTIIYHDALKNGPGYDEKPIIYYKLGVIYDRYPEISAWKLPESYFQACIFLRPHSPIAKKCYKKLKERIHSVYRFNGSASIPLEAKQKLNHYKSMSVEGPKPGAPRTNFYNN